MDGIMRTRIGEFGISKQGEKMEIIAYRRHDDMDVKFADGYIAKNITYRNFKTGEVGNPNFYQKRVGETKLSNCGMQMKIIAYRKSSDLDVEFEDGTIVKNIKYQAFRKGEIKNPNFYKAKYIGKKTMANCKMQMEVIEYRNSMDIDVIFEDGTIVKNKTYRDFKTGEIKPPYVTNYKGKDIFLNLNNITGKNLFDKYYHCKCSKCGLDTVLTIKEAKEHKC